MPDEVPADILVVADEDDGHARKVAAQLRALGAQVVRWNLSDLRSIPHVGKVGALSLWIDDSWAQVTSSTTVWWRRAGAVDVAGLDADETQLVVEEAPNLLRGPLIAAGVRWIDDPFLVERAEVRFSQAVAARQFQTPATMQTNYADGAVELTSAGPVIAKAVSSGEGIVPFVDVLRDAELAKLTGNPTFLQQFVIASADLRAVTVAGESWVWRRDRTSGVVDWRRVDPDGTSFVPTENQEVAERSTEITARLRLTMGVSDWLETPSGPVLLEVNPQGNFLFLVGAEELVVPAIARHLFMPVVSTAVVQSDGEWPRALRRVAWDLGRRGPAPPNDGIVPPAVPRPGWIDRVAVVPAAVDAAKAANEAARSATATAEAKASRLVQLGLAVLAFALALGAYQLTFDLARSPAWLPTLIPVGISIVCLALAIFEAGEIDRVGFYRELRASDFDGVGPRGASAVQIEVEETGRDLARWTANHKISDLMQARAWLARGLIALLIAALTAGVCRAASNSPSAAGQTQQLPAVTVGGSAPVHG